MELKYLIIHCTATREGMEVSSDKLRKMHTAPISQGGRGWKQVGYTDMIHLNGTVERLVKNNEDGVVDPREVTNGAKGYNSTSRHIVYVGGLDATGKPKDTRTSSQLKSLRKYVADFKLKHPTVKIIGHRDVNKNKACPCFDVAKWMKEEKL